MLSIYFFKELQIPFGKFFGKISYSIYLTHTIIGASLINILSHHYTLWWQKIIVILSGFILTIISSYILYLLVEKPSKKLSSQLKYNHENRPDH